MKGFLKLTKNNKAKLLNIGFWLFLATLIVVFFFFHGFNADEGEILDSAWNLIHHQKLYFDFFAFFPPAGPYFVFLIWKIFGASFLSAKVGSILLYCLGVVGVYKIAKELSNGSGRFISPLLFVLLSANWWLINHNSFNVPFIIWASYLFIIWIKKQKISYLSLSGLLTGISILFLQQRGLALAMAFFIFITILVISKKISWKNLITYFGSSVFPLLILLAWPLKLIYLNLIELPMSFYIQTNSNSHGLFYILLIINLLFTIWTITKKETDTRVWLLILAQLFLALSAYPLPDFFHLSQVAFPSIILFGLMIEKNKYSNRTNYKVATTITLLILTIIILSFNFKFLPRSFFQKNNIIKIVKEKCPGQYLYAGPFIPNFYFETGKLNATPYSFIISGQQRKEEAFEQGLTAIKEKKPSCAVLFYPDYLINRLGHNPDNILESYIRENYQLIFEKNKFFIYKIK